jgi:hypothetical protein
MTLSGEILSEHLLSFILSSLEVALCSTWILHVEIASRLNREQFIVQPRNLRARFEVWDVQRRSLGIAWWLGAKLLSSELTNFIYPLFHPLSLSTSQIFNNCPNHIYCIPSKCFSRCPQTSKLVPKPGEMSRCGTVNK